MVVQHMAGYPAPVAELAAAAGLTPSRVVEDAAHGLGAARDGRRIGADSQAACLSFYATKNLPISEGGAVVTCDARLAETVRQTRLHGMSRDAWRRYLPGGSWRYDVDTTGLKANLTDVQAAIGRAQLRYLPAWQQRRAEIADRYDERLADVPGLRLPSAPARRRARLAPLPGAGAASLRDGPRPARRRARASGASAPRCISSRCTR